MVCISATLPWTGGELLARMLDWRREPCGPASLSWSIKNGLTFSGGGQVVSQFAVTETTCSYEHSSSVMASIRTPSPVTSSSNSTVNVTFTLKPPIPR